MVGPEDSNAPLHVRQNVYVLDAHPKKGDTLKVPVYHGFQPFLYVAEGEISAKDFKLKKQESITDLDNPLPPITAIEELSVLLFFVDMDAAMSMAGTVSGNREPYK